MFLKNLRRQSILFLDLNGKMKEFVLIFRSE